MKIVQLTLLTEVIKNTKEIMVLVAKEDISTRTRKE